MRLWHGWQDMSGHVGLWENADRVKVVARKAAHKPALIAAGFAEHHLVNTTRVLGIDFAAGRLIGRLEQKGMRMWIAFHCCLSTPI